MNILKLPAVALISLGLAACGSTPVFQVKPISMLPDESSPNESEPTLIPEGAHINFVAKEFTFKVTQTLQGCGTDYDSLKVKTTLEPVERLVTDYNFQFAIKPVDSKTVDLKKFVLNTSQLGLVTSLNTQSDDRTAEIISNTLGSFIKVLSPLSAVGEKSGETPTELCNKDTHSALGSAAKLKKAQSNFKAAKAKLAKELAKKKDEQNETTLNTLAAEVKTAQGALNQAQKNKAAADQFLSTNHQKLITIEELYETQEFELNPPAEWIKRIAAGTGEADAIASKVKVKVGFRKLGNQKIENRDAIIEAYREKPNHLPYRTPGSAEIWSCVSDGCDYTETDLRLESVYTRIPQFGTYGAMPLTVKRFGSNTFKFEAYEDGGMKTFEYSSTASAEKASKALLDATSDIVEFRATKKAADLKSDEIDKLTAENELLKLQIENKQSKNTLESL